MYAGKEQRILGQRQLFGCDLCLRLCVRLNYLPLNLCNLQVLHHMMNTMADDGEQLGRKLKKKNQFKREHMKNQPSHRSLKFFPLQTSFRASAGLKE